MQQQCVVRGTIVLGTRRYLWWWGTVMLEHGGSRVVVHGVDCRVLLLSALQVCVRGAQLPQGPEEGRGAAQGTGHRAWQHRRSS